MTGALQGGRTIAGPVWDQQRWRPLPPLEGELTADVGVVGLGGSGLSCIRELQRLGARVVGVDAGPVGGGAAGRNGGFLLAGLYAFYHDAVAAVGRERARRIYRLTLEQIERIATETPEVVRRVGSLRIACSPEEEEDCVRQLEAMRADALPVEWYEGAEGTGLLIPSDAAFNPLARCRRLAEDAAGGGALLFERSPAVEIGPGVIHTPSGRVRCEHVIVAVDGQLERLFPQLAVRVRTARLQMLATAPTRELHVPRPVYFRWGYEYWQQLPDGRIALGGFRDRGGEGEWTHSSSPSAPVQAALEQFLRAHLGVHAPITHRWAAPVGFTPNGLPLLTEVQSRVWALGGYSGTGNVIGALAGRAAAHLAVHGASDLAVVANS